MILNGKKVFIMSGPSASGKSTYIRNNMAEGCVWVSRDKIRFSMLEPGEDYFAHEDDVFDTFINTINQVLEDPNVHTIYIDATHLNKPSRYKTISRLNRQLIEELNCICLITSFETCKKRNANREGREKVPEDALERMYFSFNYPKKNEPFNHVYCVYENGKKEEVKYKDE